MNKALKKVVRDWQGCMKCPLHKTRHEIVFYRGDAPCDVLFLGEAPGKDEDLFGEPFIGRAGQLLDQWIEDSKAELLTNHSDNGYEWRAAHYTFGITNVIACKPTDDKGKIRPPNKEEAIACSRRLIDTIAAASPKLIILLGQVAKKYHKIPAGLENVPVVEIQHPAYVLRQGGIGSYSYDSNLLKLVEALETHLYGQKEKVVSGKKPTTLGKKTTGRKNDKGSDQAVKVRIDQTGARKPRSERDQSSKRPRKKAT